MEGCAPGRAATSEGTQGRRHACLPHLVMPTNAGPLQTVLFALPRPSPVQSSCGWGRRLAVAAGGWLVLTEAGGGCGAARCPAAARAGSVAGHPKQHRTSLLPLPCYSGPEQQPFHHCHTPPRPCRRPGTPGAPVTSHGGRGPRAPCPPRFLPHDDPVMKQGGVHGVVRTSPRPRSGCLRSWGG